MREVSEIRKDLAELARMRRFLNHSERELTAEMWQAMERDAEAPAV